MNRKLFKSIREYKKQSVLAPLFVVLEVFMEVLIPFQMAKIIDNGINNGDLSYIVIMGVILVAMAMLALYFGVKAGNYAAVAAAGYAKNLRHDIFYKIQAFSFKNIDNFSTSGLVTRLTTGYKQCPDCLYDEHSSACESADYDYIVMGHDFAYQCENCLAFPCCHPAFRRPAHFYRKEGASAFYQGF